MTTVRTPPRDAIDTALAFADCVTCGHRIAAVDCTRDKDGELKGGQWIHVELPPTVHAATPPRRPSTVKPIPIDTTLTTTEGGPAACDVTTESEGLADE